MKGYKVTLIVKVKNRTNVIERLKKQIAKGKYLLLGLDDLEKALEKIRS